MTNLPKELAYAQGTAKTAWKLYTEVSESGAPWCEVEPMLAKALACDECVHRWYERWQEVGGTSDIESILEVEWEAERAKAERWAAEQQNVSPQLPITLGWMKEAEADGQEFMDVKFGSKQWFDNIEEIEF